MTPELAFECLLVSHDPAVVRTLNPILQNLAICTSVCADPSNAAAVLGQVSTDLIVVDLESDSSSELVRRIQKSDIHQKPTILAISDMDRAVPGVHVVLRKPVTPESGLTSLKAAYSRMLRDFRKHTRFALMASVLATDERNRSLTVIVTNIGQGGVGLTTKAKLAIGTILSFDVGLPGLKTEIQIRARVLWTRDYGAAGCEFVRLAPLGLQLLHAWLESRYRIKKPLIPV